MNTLLESARQLWQQDGFSVFPMVYRDKVPFKAWPWKILQTRKPTEEELTAWFAGPVNLAVVTGAVSGDLLVLDFDDLEVFSIWYTLTGLDTRTATTGKGVHCYFRCVDGFNGDFYVDGKLGGQARFTGGYVVAPPSVHPSGAVYQWSVDTDLLTVDRRVLQVTPKPERLGPSSDRAAAADRLTTPGRGVKDPAKYAETALARECQAVRLAEEHTRNNTLYRSALKCWKFVDVIGQETMFRAFVQAGIDSGLPEHEAGRTVLNAWTTARY